MEDIVKDALRTSGGSGFSQHGSAGSHGGKPSANEVFMTPKIMVVGSGGGGCNSINRLARAGIKGADLVAINTDKLHLQTIHEGVKKVLIGASITRGIGAGGYPEVGQKAADTSRDALEKLFS